MNDFKTDSPRPATGRRRLMVAAVIVVAAIAVLAATGGLSDFVNGFNNGIHAAPNGPTVAR